MCKHDGVSFSVFVTTVVIGNFWTDRCEQTVQTQIRLLLEEQSDQSLHCFLFSLHLLEVSHLLV